MSGNTGNKIRCLEAKSIWDKHELLRDLLGFFTLNSDPNSKS